MFDILSFTHLVKASLKKKEEKTSNAVDKFFRFDKSQYHSSLFLYHNVSTDTVISFHPVKNSYGKIYYIHYFKGSEKGNIDFVGYIKKTIMCHTTNTGSGKLYVSMVLHIYLVIFIDKSNNILLFYTIALLY